MKKKTEKIYRIGIFITLLISVTIVVAVACVYGCSTLDFPTGLTVAGAMVLGFVIIFKICCEEKKPSE